MLLELYIENIAIVDELRVRFEPGFSVLTGETGAGKSVILGALSLVLGERVKGELLSDGAERGLVEALFEIPKTHPAVSYLSAQNFCFSGEEPLVLRREILRNGNHRNYVNGQYVSLAILKNLGDFAKVNQIYATYFPKNPPARSTVEVSRLPREANIEIECIVEIAAQ